MESKLFQRPISLEEVIQLLEALPEEEPLPPTTPPTVPLKEVLQLKRPNLAVHTVNGWTFRAGATLRAERDLWEKWAPDEEVRATIREGWKGLHKVGIAPAWFQSYDMEPEAAEVWHKEHTAMWQAGVVNPITKEWIRKHGPPCPGRRLPRVSDRYPTLLHETL